MNKSFKERGGYWVLGQALLMGGILGLGLGFHSPSRHAGWLAMGIILLILAAGIGAAGALALGRNLTPFPHPLPDGRLVCHGIYAWIRHPLYTAVALAGFGWALLWPSWPALLLAIGLGLFFNAKARHEEDYLRRHFPEYAEYEKRSRRFIPGIY